MSGSLTSYLRSELLALYGPLIGGEELMRAAGFRTANAFKLAARRGRVGFDVFQITGRRGQFARTSDVAEWLNSIGRVTRARSLDIEGGERVSLAAHKPSKKSKPKGGGGDESNLKRQKPRS